MKGLAKKNNKTRGKITHRKKNNRKTIRKGKKRGGGGLEDNFNDEKTLQQQKAELMSRKNKAGEDYQKILNITAYDFKKVEIDFVNFVKQIRGEYGYTETKDENQHPNKKSKINYDAEEKVAAAEKKLENIMNSLNEEREIATNKYKAEKKEIEDKLTNIEKQERHKIADEEFQRKQDIKTQERMVENMKKGLYINPDEPRDQHGPLQFVSQERELDKDATKRAKQDEEDFNNNVITFNGGKKRKTHKKRK